MAVLAVRDPRGVGEEVGVSASRVGVDPIECLHAIENHDQAYYLWREADVKSRILVHIDAHHDMWWIDDRSVTIANFICPALKPFNCSGAIASRPELRPIWRSG